LVDLRSVSKVEREGLRSCVMSHKVWRRYGKRWSIKVRTQ
jgi:hypothetical protein